MALRIEIDKDSYGSETVVGKAVGGKFPKSERLHCLAKLYDGTTLIAKRLVQNIDPDDEADMEARVQAAFPGFEEGSKPEPEKSELDVAEKVSTWKTTIASPVLPEAEAVKAVEPK